MTVVQGRRRDLTEWSWTEEDAPKSGDYGKYPNGDWYAITPSPSALPAGLKKHTVVENEDGTITVSPSILSTHWDGTQYHGYLTNGIWSEV